MVAGQGLMYPEGKVRERLGTVALVLQHPFTCSVNMFPNIGATDIEHCTFVINLM